MYHCFYNQFLEPGQEVVMLSQVLAHTCNIGYEKMRDVVLSKYNGRRIINLRHLKNLIEEDHDYYSEQAISSNDDVELYNNNFSMPAGIELKKMTSTTKATSRKTQRKSKPNPSSSRGSTAKSEQMVFEFSGGQIVVLSRKNALEAREHLCREHFIPVYCSNDLLI